MAQTAPLAPGKFFSAERDHKSVPRRFRQRANHNACSKGSEFAVLCSWPLASDGAVDGLNCTRTTWDLMDGYGGAACLDLVARDFSGWPPGQRILYVYKAKKHNIPSCSNRRGLLKGNSSILAGSRRVASQNIRSTMKRDEHSGKNKSPHLH